MTSRIFPTRLRAAPTATVLDPAPAYLSRVSDDVLRPGQDRTFARELMASLDRIGIAARPSLAAIEAERARRGMRPGLTVAAHVRQVLPMPMPEPGALLDLTDERERGRRAVDRIRARFHPADATDVYRDAVRTAREAA